MLLPHEVLGVSPDADLPTIKRVFRALAKEWHPDRSRDPKAAARFHKLVSAYRNLVHARTNRAQLPRVPSIPSWPVADSVDAGDDLTWDNRAAVSLRAYPARLARIAILGTVGTVALFWVSAFLSHL